MDSACYDSTDNLIIAVRGGRIYQCNATSGQIITQSDYMQVPMGHGTVVWDSGTNRCFATAWNVAHNTGLNFENPARNFFRIVPNTLAVDLTSNFDTVFGVASANYYLEYGLGPMKTIGGWVYALGWLSSFGVLRIGAFRFSAANVAVNAHTIIGNGGLPYFAYASIGGEDLIYYNIPGTFVEWHNFTTLATADGPGDTLRNRIAVEYVPSVNQVFFTDEFRYIYIYNTAGVYQSTIDTGRAGFNGVNIRLNPNDGLLYVAGGADNTVVVVTPATSAFVVKTGFDLPWDFVFTPTKKFAVQQGAVGLKEIT